MSTPAPRPVTGRAIPPRRPFPPAGAGHTEDVAADFPATGLPAAGFPAGGFLPAADFPAADFPAADFPASGFPATDFPAAAFPAADFPATDFPATDFPAADFPAADFADPHFASDAPASGFPPGGGGDLPASDFPASDFPAGRPGSGAPGHWRSGPAGGRRFRGQRHGQRWPPPAEHHGQRPAGAPAQASGWRQRRPGGSSPPQARPPARPGEPLFDPFDADLPESEPRPKYVWNPADPTDAFPTVASSEPPAEDNGNGPARRGDR